MRRYFINTILLLGLVLLPLPVFASTDLYVSTTGYVGINTTAPAYLLDVLGSTTSNVERISSSSTEATNTLFSNTTTGGETWYAGTVGASNSFGETAGDFHIGLNGVGAYVSIGSGGTVTIPGDLTVAGIATLGNGSTATTQTAGDNSTKIATTAYVDSATSGSGGMVLLQTVHASSVASVAIGSSFITSTYNKYVIEYDSLAFSNNSLAIEMLVSTDGGSTYKTTGYINSTGAVSSYLDICGGITSSTGAGDAVSGTIKFSVPSSTSLGVAFESTAMQVQPSGPATFFSSPRMGFYGTTGAAINGLKVQLNGGGTMSGNFHLYGLSGT